MGEGSIDEPVFAQIAKSTYIPQNYEYERFMSVDKFKEYQKEAGLIISHGGTGALIGALKMGKKVIATPRLAKYGEHIDDHQLQVVGVLESEGYLRSVVDMADLLPCIQSFKDNPISKTYDQPSHVLEIIEEFLDNNL